MKEGDSIKDHVILYVIAFLMACAFFLGFILEKAYPESRPPDPRYTVQAGDTLGNIASKFNTTWQEIWKLNPDIKDPNLIYPGQKLMIKGQAKPVPPPLTKEQKLNKLVRFMFKVSGLNYVDKKQLESAMEMYRETLNGKYYDFSNQRKVMDIYYTATRQYEIWLLAEAIIDVCKTDEDFYRMVGLAWQESHFINRRGKHGEIGFFQILPSTLKSHFALDDIGFVSMAFNVENFPKVATEIAYSMITSYKWNWEIWNHGLDYQYHLNNKIYHVKQEFLRR